MPDTISVIIATYDRPQHLRRVVEAYFDQTRRPDEIVIADDGSGAETRQVVDQLVAAAPCAVRHVWHAHDGFRAAKIRNRASAASRGDYIINADGDCLPSRHFVADHLRLARPGHFVQGKVVHVEPAIADQFTGREPWWRWVGWWLRGDLRKARLYKLLHLPGWAQRRGGRVMALGGLLSYFRSDLYRINGWDEQYQGWGKEDDDLTIRLQRAGVQRLIAIGSVVAFHLPHPRPSLDAVERNRARLDAALTGPMRAALGIDQYPDARATT